MSTQRDILLVGDAMVDAYLRTEPVGISDEAPVAVLDWVGVRRTFGGMMNVAASCAACGGVRVIGVIGDDEPGQFLREETQRCEMDAHWLHDGRPTVEKTRVVAGDQESMLARLDVEVTTPIDDKTAEQLIAAAHDVLPRCGVLLVSDYRKGAITPTVARGLLGAAKDHGVPVLVDAKPESMDWFKGATLLTPNEREARLFAQQHGIECATTDELGKTLAATLDAAVLITRSAEGMTLFDKAGNRLAHFNAEVDRPLSTSGAGDVVMAVIGVSIVRGKTLTEAVEAAARTVAKAIRRDGTCRIEPGDL